MLAYRHFQEKKHVFNKHAKFIIIDKLTKVDWKRKILHSNAENATAKRNNKKTAALLLNVQFYQFHHCHVNYEAKFRHILSKLFDVISLCKNLFLSKYPWEMAAAETSRENSLTSTNLYFYVQQHIYIYIYMYTYNSCRFIIYLYA